MNNGPPEERAKKPFAGNWKFIPFQPEGCITDAHIVNMICAQNCYLRNTVLISMMGLQAIKSLITAPRHREKLSFHCWLLTVKNVNESMHLFTSVDSNPSNMYYFCTETVHGEETT
eukprot:3852882-Ditylum_brightwellii.AAC.1